MSAVYRTAGPSRCRDLVWNKAPVNVDVSSSLRRRIAGKFPWPEAASPSCRTIIEALYQGLLAGAHDIERKYILLVFDAPQEFDGFDLRMNKRCR